MHKVRVVQSDADSIEGDKAFRIGYMESEGQHLVLYWNGSLATPSWCMRIFTV